MTTTLRLSMATTRVITKMAMNNKIARCVAELASTIQTVQDKCDKNRKNGVFDQLKIGKVKTKNSFVELQIETKVDKCGKIDKIVLSSGKSRQNRQNAAKSTKSFCRATKCDKIDKSKDKARQFLSSLDFFYLDGRFRQKLKNLDSLYLAMSTVGNCRHK